MFDPGLVSSNAHCGNVCENYETERAHEKSGDSSRDVSRPRHLAVQCASCIH